MEALIDKGELEDALVLFMREGPKMPDHELKIYRQLPMWPRRVQHVPTIPREIAIDWTYTFNGEKFAEVQVPTMLLLGGDSPPYFHKGTALIDAALPTSQIVTMSGQQHIAMDTNPNLFVKEVLRFLSE
jgi:pimeloyl-ACP methyl ester carboxylesterase